MLKDNKAQTEIFGLIIVVVIITFVIVFSLVFFAKPKSFYVGNERILASNWIEATLAMHTDCSGRTVEDLLKNCAEAGNGGVICPADQQGRKLGTCKKSETIINDILRKTFGTWQIKHKLIFNRSKPLEDLEFACNFKSCQEWESAFRNVPISGGQEFSMIMQICKDIPIGREPSCV